LRKMWMILGVLLLVVQPGASWQYSQYNSFSAKLDRLLRHLDSVGSELKTLNTAYLSLKQEGDKYIEYETDIGELAPLLGAARDRTETWQDNLDRCKWSENSGSTEDYDGGKILTKKIFCDDNNYFLTYLEYSDTRGVHNGKCCKRIKS